MKSALKTVVLGSLIASLLVSAVITSVAQDRGGRGGGNFDPSEFRARMLERMQEALEFSSEEWEVVSPMVSKVMEKQQAAQTGGGMGFLFRRGGDGGRGQGGPGGPGGGRGGRGGRGGFGGFGAEPSQAQTALETVLEKDDASADDIKSKLTAFRSERKKNEADLKAAREDLRKVLSVKQEAMLVLAGMLD